MHASTLTIDPAQPNAQSPTIQPTIPTLLESRMSTLVGNPAVPNGKYRILPAADPTLALEMQSGGDFKAHVAELDESSKTQIWKIVPHTDTKDDTKYQIKNSTNCGILGINKFKDSVDDVFVACSLHEYFWTIEPRGRSFIIANAGSEDAILSDDTASVHAQRIGQIPRRWFLSPANLFQPTNEYKLKISHRENFILDFDHWKNLLHGWEWLGLKHQRWNIINVGQGIYHLKCIHEGFYVGWEEKNFDNGGKVMMSKTPHRWAITSSSSGTHQFWAATSDKPIAPLGLGDLSGDALKLSSKPAFWTITAV